MNLALQQANFNLGQTKTNPSVGCVIVNDDTVISAGFTQRNGRPHAEFNAIKKIKKKSKNLHLYVTLEPCSHQGFTPPCTSLIYKNRIKKVFFSIKDPDLRSYNRSTPFFKKRNIKVKTGILSSKINDFYKSYINFKTNNLPYISAKIAISEDYYTVNNKNKWITNKYSRGRVHLLRSKHDCILTSGRTIKIDNPYLNCRINGLEKNSPTRVILDKNFDIPIKSNIVKTSNLYPTVIFFNKTNNKKLSHLKKLKIKLIYQSLNENGDFDLVTILKKLKFLGYSRIFVESGQNLITKFLSEKLVNTLYIFKSQIKLGRNGRNNFKKSIKLCKKKKSHVEKVNLLGDKLILYKIK